MNNRLFRVLFLAVLLLTLAALGIAPLAAHEGREVGEYLISFGWRVEPAYAGMLNGPEVFIEAHEHSHSKLSTQHDEDSPLEGVTVELQVEVTFGDQTMTMPLVPAYNEAGRYVADMIPTLPGDYIFRVTGTIGEETVDETFDSADGEFSSVEPASDILFPVIDAAENDRLAALEARIAALEALIAEMQAGQ